MKRKSKRKPKDTALKKWRDQLARVAAGHPGKSAAANIALMGQYYINILDKEAVPGITFGSLVAMGVIKKAMWGDPFAAKEIRESVAESIEKKDVLAGLRELGVENVDEFMNTLSDAIAKELGV